MPERMRRAGLRLAGLLLAALAAALPGAPPAGAAAPPSVAGALQAARAPVSQLSLVDTVASAGARFYRYRQRVDGLPVLGAEAVVTDGVRPGADLIVDHSRRGVVVPPPARIGARSAIVAARRGLRLDVSGARATASLAIAPEGLRLVWRVVVRSSAPRGVFEVLVGARDGEIVRVRDLLVHATGVASIFDPNPVVAQGSRDDLADADDADSGLLTSLRVPVTLERLADAGNCLDGRWAHVTGPGGEVCASGSDFTALTRSDYRFEAVMAYAHIDRAQAYLQSLGLAAAGDRQVPVDVNGFPEDNSYFDLSTRSMAFGTGGIDDAEDADVIVHEYGHAVQEDQVPGFPNGTEAGALGEGFADYLAAAVSAVGGPHGDFDVCLAEWDALGYGTPRPCLRRVDSTMTLQQALASPACAVNVHCVGQVWSAALWSIRAAIGGPAADRLVVQSNFGLTPTARFEQASQSLIAADAQLDGGQHRDLLVDILAARGLVDRERTDDTPGTAPTLAVPGRTVGRLDAAGDAHDVRAVALSAGQGIVVRMSGTGGDFDLRLLRPGTTATSEDGATVAGSTAAGIADEVFTYRAVAAGIHYLDIAAASGAGSYAVRVDPDADLDGVPDGTGSAGAGSPAPSPQRAGRQPRSPSPRVELYAIVRLRRAFLVRGRLLPTTLPAGAWRVAVQARRCAGGRCRWRRFAEAAAARAAPDGRVQVRLVLPRGRYRLRAVLRATGLAIAPSPWRRLDARPRRRARA